MDQDSPWDNFTCILADSLGVERSMVGHETSFTEIGGTSLNIVSTVLKLQESGCSITIDQFLKANNLKTLFESTPRLATGELTQNNEKFVVVPLAEVERAKAQILVAESFLQKSELFGKNCGMTVEDFVHVIDHLWEVLLPFSIAVIDTSKTLRAVALAADDTDLGNASLDNFHPYFMNILAMLSSVSDPVRITYDSASRKGVILCKFLVGGAISNTGEENVLAFSLLEKELVHKAKEHHFHATLAENISPLTQQLSKYLGCKRYGTQSLRKWKNACGQQPFHWCSDELFVAVDVMDLNE